MNLNDPASSQPVPFGERSTKRYSAAFQKAQRYVGLIAVVWLAWVLLFPGRSRTDELHPFISNKSYHHKTLLTQIVIFYSLYDTEEVRSAGKHIVDCEWAKRLAYPNGRDLSPEALATYMKHLPQYEKKKAEQRILDACGLYILGSPQNQVRAKEVDPMYWDLIGRFYELRKEALATQGLTDKNQPAPTSEMILIDERLKKISGPLIQESADRLIFTNGIAHVLVAILIGIGVWFRGRVGWVLLAPFGWAFSSAKKVHEKI